MLSYKEWFAGIGQCGEGGGGESSDMDWFSHILLFQDIKLVFYFLLSVTE